MDFTFGIITDGKSELLQIIESIKEQRIPNYEIIIVGNTSIQSENTTVIQFDETIKKAWITKKKNLICQHAKYENIVLIHDYIKFDKDWYSGFLKFGNDFDYCVTKIKTIDGRRYRDFTLYQGGLENLFSSCLLPYSYNPPDNIRKLLYISGAYYIIKKRIALEYPLNEDLIHGGGEDVELSQRLATNNIHIQCNIHSSVSLLKHAWQCNWENVLSDEQMLFLNSLDSDELFRKQKIQIREWISSTQNVSYQMY